jgi:hypothetical protein
MQPRLFLGLFLALVVSLVTVFASRGSAPAPAPYALPTYLVQPAQAASCAPWDIKSMCCPAYCAADRTGSTNWTRKNEIFKGCLAGLGCDSSTVQGANGFISCGRGDDPKCGQ